MSDEWYYQSAGSPVGPLSWEALIAEINEGRVSPNTLVRPGTTGLWISASRIEGLFAGTAVTQVFTSAPVYETRPYDETVALGAIPPPVHHLPTAHELREAHHKPHSTPVSLPAWLLGMLIAVAALSVIVVVKVASSPPAKKASPSTESRAAAAPRAEYADLARQVDSLLASTAKEMELIVPQLAAEVRAIESSGTAPDEKTGKQRAAVVESQKKVYAAVSELRHLSRDIKDLLEQHPGKAELKQMVQKLDAQRDRCATLANTLPDVH